VIVPNCVKYSLKKPSKYYHRLCPSISVSLLLCAPSELDNCITDYWWSGGYYYYPWCKKGLEFGEWVSAYRWSR